MSSFIFCRRGALGCSRAHFNPRTPYGVRPCQVHLPLCPQHISIHAPLAGCDTTQTVVVAGRAQISIHAPLAGCNAEGVYWDIIRYAKFQSTHPLRGATAGAELLAVPGLISIHAPLAGCDHPARCSSRQGHHFNPRTPCGVRHPVASGDGHGHGISIHAPLAGCDAGYDYDTVQDRVFQSTHPLRGATVMDAFYAVHRKISIHAPLAGCDVNMAHIGKLNDDFNPRTPCGVRQQKYTNSSVYFCDKRLFLDSFTQNAAF